MERYDIAVVDGRDTTVVATDVDLPDQSAIWIHIGRIARAFNRPGRLIRVTNRSGGVVVLIGVATALQLYLHLSGGVGPG